MTPRRCNLRSRLAYYLFQRGSAISWCRQILHQAAKCQPHAAPGPSNLDVDANSYKGKGKGKFRQSLPPTQQTRPCGGHWLQQGVSLVSNNQQRNQQRHVAAAATMCEDIPAMMAYMASFPGKPAPIPHALAKPVAQRAPGQCWVKNCYGMNPLHNHWQHCPKVAAHFWTRDLPGCCKSLLVTD